MTRASEGTPVAIPMEYLPWAVAHARDTIAELEARGYAVAGDLRTWSRFRYTMPGPRTTPPRTNSSTAYLM